jgi:hypothetical protein
MAFGKLKPARERTPSSPPGESVEIALTLDADGRERTFRVLRTILPGGRWARVVITRDRVRVEGLRRGDVGAVCPVLDRLAEEVAPRPARREVA